MKREHVIARNVSNETIYPKAKFPRLQLAGKRGILT